MFYFLKDGFFSSPHFIFIKSEDLSYSSILTLLAQEDWQPLKGNNFEAVKDPDKYYIFFTKIGKWVHLMDWWSYTLWFDKTLNDRLKNISKDYDVLRCSVGDTDESFDFRFFQGGNLIREYVVEDPNYDGGFVTSNIGKPFKGEERALKEKDEFKRIKILASIFGINTEHSLDKIQIFWREEYESEKFIFNEDEY